MNTFENLTIIIFFIGIVVYIIVAYITISKRDIQNFMIKNFYKAVCNVYKTYNETYKEITIDDLFVQLNLNYEKLCQTYPSNTYTSILDLVKTIIHYYDIFSYKLFKRFFRVEKNQEIRELMVEICNYIVNINPFISVPKKEADLLYSIKDALENDNCSLGMTSLMHLSQEIDNKEKLLKKQEKQNKLTTIISIVGIILTIFFGVLSFIKIV